MGDMLHLDAAEPPDVQEDPPDQEGDDGYADDERKNVARSRDHIVDRA